MELWSWQLIRSLKVAGSKPPPGGKFVALGNPARLEDVVNIALIEVRAGANDMALQGSSFVNNGTVAVESTVRVDSNVTVSGTGEIQLGVIADCCSNFTISSDVTATNAAGHTIRGITGAISRINGPGTLINDGIIVGAGPAELVDINTRIEGSGTLKNLRSDVALGPGSGVGDTAQVTLEGAFNIVNLGATLELEIGGTTPGLEYDQLISTDPANAITFASANTQLNVSFIDGFFPNNGDIFTLVDTAGVISGSLSSINLPVLRLVTPGTTYQMQTRLPINSSRLWRQISTRTAMSTATT